MKIGLLNLELFIFIILLLIILFFTDLFLLDNLRITVDGMFTGFLALAGFIFTARTFITFKLNEVIYSDDSYREYVEKLRNDGAYKKELYDPLKKLDENLGNTTAVCLLSTIMIALFACVPKIDQSKIDELIKNKSIYEILFNYSLNFLEVKNIYIIFVQKILSSITISFVILAVYKTLTSLRSINKNIGDVILTWEEKFNKKE